MGGDFEFSLGYKYADTSVTFFSALGRTVEGVKPPWDPPVSCEYTVVRRNDVDTEYFKFLSRRGDNQHLPVKRLNNLFAGESDFTRRCTAMIVDSRKELLGLYMTLLPHSKGFSHHRPDLHNELGMRLDGKGITVNILIQKMGGIEEFVEFKEMAEKAAFKVTKSRIDAISAIEELRNCKKRKSEKEGGGGKVVKMTKMQEKVNAQLTEIKDESGVERAFIDSYVGRCDVKIENISVSSKICPRINKYKVDGIANVMMSRFDPSKIHLTVCPADPQNFDLSRLTENQFTVISGNHSLMALKKLDSTGDMRNKVSMADGLINCYIVNTQDPSVLCYGNIRSNDLDSKHVRKPQLQDLLFVFNTLRGQFKNDAEAVKVVVRYATLLVVGADDVTALKKLCSWQSSSFDDLLKVIQLYETYETKDGCFQGNQARLLRGEPLPLRTILFKKLSKVKEEYFVENHPSVLKRDISLKDLVESFGTSEMRRSVVDAILHLCKSQSLIELQGQYPGKFSDEKIDEFKGAVVFGPKKNRVGELVDEYCEAVLADEERYESAVQLKVLDDSVDADYLAEYNVVVVNFKEDQPDLVMQIVEELLSATADQKLKTLLVLFNQEVGQSTTLSYIRNLKLPESSIVSPIIFDIPGKLKGQIVENLRFGVFVSMIEVFYPPLKVYNGSQDSLKEVVFRICPPGGSVAYVSDDGFLPIPILHCSDNKTRTVTYFANEETLEHFRRRLVAEKASGAGTMRNASRVTAVEAEEVRKEDLEAADKAQMLLKKKNRPEVTTAVENQKVMKDKGREEDFNVGVGAAMHEDKPEGSDSDPYKFDESDSDFDKKINESIKTCEVLIADIDQTEREYLAIKRSSSTSGITYK